MEGGRGGCRRSVGGKEEGFGESGAGGRGLLLEGHRGVVGKGGGAACVRAPATRGVACAAVGLEEGRGWISKGLIELKFQIWKMRV